MIENSRPITNLNRLQGGRHHRSMRGRRRPDWVRGALVAAVTAASLTVGALVVVQFVSSGAAADTTDVRSASATAGAAALFSPPRTAVDSTTSERTAVDSTTSEMSFTSAAGAEPLAPEPSTCPLRSGLRVSATPEMVASLQQVWSSLGEAAENCALTVTSQDASDFIAAATDPAFIKPDVWIPDSSGWLERAGRAGVSVRAKGDSFATSPTVLAVTPAVAPSVPNPAAVLASRTTDTPIRVGLPDPARSMATSAVLLDLRAAALGSAGPNAALTWAMRSTPAGLPTEQHALLEQLAIQPGLALPTTEQAVFAFNAAAGSVNAVAVYGTPGYSVDYPFATLTDDGLAVLLADRLFAGLRADAGQQVLADNGFRDGAGRAAVALDAAHGVDGSVPSNASGPSAADADRVVSDVSLSNEPSQLLAVLDVSGSMASSVPGAGGATRIELARAAAVRGLGLYPQSSKIGLWEFSRTIDGPADYKEIIPVSPLSATADGVSAGQQISAALQSVQVVQDGGTGLYDTTLAAVRALRAQWDPDRVNTVLLLTDGQNDDRGSIELDQLVATLQAEQDPARPVPVIAIAFGPDTDVTALQAISQVTGGATYVAKDPRDIGEIFLDAVGRRLCRPSC